MPRSGFSSRPTSSAFGTNCGPNSKQAFGCVAWTEEVSRYLLMVLTFVGAAGAVRRGTHIRVEVLEQALPLPARKDLWAILDTGRIAAQGNVNELTDAVVKKHLQV